MHLLNFKKKLPNSLSTLFIYQLHPYQQSDMRSSSSIPLLTLAIVFLITDILVAVKWYLIKISIWISLSSSGHVWMWELDCDESWAPKNWCFWTVVLEKTLESPLDCKEIQLAHSKGDQSWVFIRRTNAKAETPVLWPPHVKSWLTGKDPDAGKDWGQEEKGMKEDEMVGWHHWLNGHKFGYTPGVGDK